MTALIFTLIYTIGMWYILWNIQTRNGQYSFWSSFTKKSKNIQAPLFEGLLGIFVFGITPLMGLIAVLLNL